MFDLVLVMRMFDLFRAFFADGGDEDTLSNEYGHVEEE